MVAGYSYNLRVLLYHQLSFDENRLKQPDFRTKKTFTGQQLDAQIYCELQCIGLMLVILIVSLSHIFLE